MRLDRRVEPRNQIAILLAFCILLVPLIVVWSEIPTNDYRNVFFYADIHVANSILETGHIPNDVPGGRKTGIYWGKISNQQSVPIYPTIIAMFSTVTGLPTNSLYIYFPGYVLGALAFYVLVKEIIENQTVSLLFAAVASLPPNIKIEYAFSFVSAATVVFILSILMVLKIMNAEKERITGRYGLMLSLFLMWNFYFYPPTYGIVYGLIGIIFIIFVVRNIYTRSIIPRAFLVPFIVGTILLPVFFALPVYRHYTADAALNLFAGRLVTSEPGLEIFALSSTYYSLLPSIVLLPLGGIGGFVCFYRIYDIWEENNSVREMIEECPGALLLISWGIVILVSGLLYLSAGEVWLITRAYDWSLPLLFVAGAVGLVWLSDKTSRPIGTISLIILIAIISSTCYLQATDPRMEIQTYQTGITEGGEWVAEHESGQVVGDTKMGAAVVANEYYDYTYPLQIQDAQQLFYTNDMAQYYEYLEKVDADTVVFYEGMKQDGLYVDTESLVPLSSNQYNRRLAVGNTIYDNGEVVVSKPNSDRTDST